MKQFHKFISALPFYVKEEIKQNRAVVDMLQTETHTFFACVFI